MKRVIYIESVQGREEKFVLRKEFEGFGIYEEMCPNGYFVHQSYLVADEKTIIVSYSFNSMCYAEMLDLIESIIESRKNHEKMGYKAIKKYDKRNQKFIYILHSQGDLI